MFDELAVWAVEALRTDVTLVSGRVTVADASYVNPVLPRVQLGRASGMSEEQAFIGNLTGDVINVTLPIHIFSRTQDKDKIVDSVISSMLTTQRNTSSGSNVLDVKPVGINFLNEESESEKPEVFHTIIDFEVMYDREA